MLGIIAAMQKEADVLLLQSKDVQCAEKFGKKVYRAEFGGIPYLLVLSGIGKDNAAAAAMLALTEGADTLLNLGVAGGRAAWMHVGTVLQAERAVEPDFDLSAINRTPVGTHDERTQPHFDLVCGDKFPKGVLASADHFQTGADAQLLQALEADVCDMEGASVAHVAWSAGVPCLIFKSISDNANEKGASDYAANCAYALQKLGERMQDIFAESTK
ncbi:MAG TPA: 5'-methylthioadenosine/S-adenosylhomocysteine nucleosidase [Candidatus Borkfalkia faecipullorum]|uniref:5'-methylthioadenosine/S-adenosylhomocysteine nucleosidase n=1 Tax=Candidatus Borkfalkia faecipullorum TaxID=2838510 RepID=A0A9D1V8A8_9FIRM|nr:5'-methylthioadenosine/S-adenosylhomocysteine nucleosidase [Candidatus Borkfalkia faecipullorum]